MEWSTVNDGKFSSSVRCYKFVEHLDPFDTRASD